MQHLIPTIKFDAVAVTYSNNSNKTMDFVTHINICVQINIKGLFSSSCFFLDTVSDKDQHLWLFSQTFNRNFRGENGKISALLFTPWSTMLIRNAFRSKHDFSICIHKGGVEDDAARLQEAKGKEMVTHRKSTYGKNNS